MSLVPICSLAKQVKTPSSLMESIILLSGQLLGRDLYREARTIRELGMEGLSPDQISTAL